MERPTAPEIIRLASVDSTNAHALSQFDSMPDNTMILAEIQTEGRGRRGRRWLSEPGGLHATIIMKGSEMSASAPLFVSTLAVLKAFRRAAPSLEFGIKWPNDILCRSSKIAGILCEAHTRSASSRPDGYVAGIGANIDMSAKTLEAVGQPATSLLAETGQPYGVEKFADLLLQEFVSCRQALGKNGIAPLFREWRAENLLLGKTVSASIAEAQPETCRLLDLMSDGSAILETKTGPRHVYSAELSVGKGIG